MMLEIKIISIIVKYMIKNFYITEVEVIGKEEI